MANRIRRCRMDGMIQEKECSSVKIVPKELTCSSCKHLFVEPKLLECLHTVCQACIRKLRVTQKGVYSFKCPSCDHLTKATDYADFSGINLPTNVYMLGLLEIYANRKALGRSCLVCSSKNDKTSAAFKCLDCGDTLCQDCSRGHNSSSSTSDHAVVSLDKLRTGSYDMEVLRRQSVTCAKHKEAYRFYCNTCASLICELCALGEHKLHRQTTLDKALEEKTETLQKVLPEKHSVMAITHRIAELAKEEERFKSRILKDTAQLTDVISRAKKGILGAARVIFEKERESLESQLSAFSRETMAMYSKVKKVGGNEFLALSESLEVALKTTKDTMPSEITLPPLKKLHAQVNGFPPGSKLMTLLNLTEGVKDQVCGSVFEGRGTFKVEKGNNAATKIEDSKARTGPNDHNMTSSKTDKNKMSSSKEDEDSKEDSKSDTHSLEVPMPDKASKRTELDKNIAKCSKVDVDAKNAPEVTSELQDTCKADSHSDKESKDQFLGAMVVNVNWAEACEEDLGTRATSVLVNDSKADSKDKVAKEIIVEKQRELEKTGKKATTSKTEQKDSDTKDKQTVENMKGKNTNGLKVQAEDSDIKPEQMTKEPSKQPSPAGSKTENKTVSESIIAGTSLMEENGGGDLIKKDPKKGILDRTPETEKPDEKRGPGKQIQDIDPLKTPVFEMSYRGLVYKNQYAIKLRSDQRPPNISCLEASRDGSIVVLDDNNCKVMFFDNSFMYHTFLRKHPDQFTPKVVAQPNGYAAVNNNALMFFQRDLVFCSAVFLEKNLNPCQRLSPVICKCNDSLMVGNLPGNVMRYYDHFGMVLGSWVSQVRGPITSLRHISGDRFIMCSWAFNGAVFIESQREGITLSICWDYKGQRNDVWHPWDACVTSKGSVIVSDCLKDEIAVFNRHGQVITRMKTGSHGLQEPRCLLVDNSNRLLVSCRGGTVAEFVLNEV